MTFKTKKDTSSLDEVLKSSWRDLHNSVKNSRHPFYRPALTTVVSNKPEVRTVILRGFSEEDRTLISYCDARTPKVSHIRNNPNVSWLFYHPKKWLQLRLCGTATVHTNNETSESQWKKVSQTNKFNYCSEMPPGSPTNKPTSGLPDFVRNKASKLLDHQQAYNNFAVIVCRFDEMDWLLLKLTGHIRAKFYWKDNHINASWIIP
jgi:hypothetical protein